MKLKWVLAVFVAWCGVTAVFAQETLRLSLSRDFGSAFGSQIQGTFSFRVEGPDNLERVVFLIDDQEIGQDTEPPFRYQFRTENYAIGVHTLSAIGYTSDGQALGSNTLQREFIAGSDSTRRALYIIIPILVISIGGRIISARIANRNNKKPGTPNVHCALGGTICPNCAKPYAFHLWSFNFVTRRIDRCPHCHKWRVVKKMPPQLLDAAAEATIQQQKAAPSSPLSDEEKLRKQLDDSRFDEG
jgi:hypothetical protein